MQPSTILYVAWAPFFSGAERALLVLLDQLDRSRYRPIVVLGTDGELASQLRARQIHTIVLPLVNIGRTTLVPWSACVFRLMRVARRERAVIVHANDLPSFQPAGFAGRLLGLPAICHLRFPDSRAGFQYFLKPGFTRALFISHSLMADSLGEAPHLFRGKSQVVYDGVLVPPLVDQPAARRLKEELGLPLDRTSIVLAGQVAEVKGLWDYIDAAAILLAQGRPFTFVVLGDDLKGKGALRVEAERVVEERGLSEHVRFLGFRPDVTRLMPAFDIVAVPSHVEPLGLTALEGMAAARPVVGSRVGGIAETVVDGTTGTLVPPRDPARLASAIDALSSNPRQAEAYGLAGRERVSAHFGVRAHAAAIQSVYDELLAGGSAKAEKPFVGSRTA